jgi:predicted ATPase
VNTKHHGDSGVITQIKIEGFKSLEKVNLTLGHFNLFVGANASGKSNFFDALRVLQGIGYGFTIDEILNGKPKSAGSEVWEPIRGGSAKADFISAAGDLGPTTKTMRFDISLKLPEREQEINYSIGISARSGSVRQEYLSLGNRTIFDSNAVYNRLEDYFNYTKYFREGREPQPVLKFERSRPVLHELLRYSDCSENDREVIEACARAISNVQRIDPSLAILRDYSQALAVKRMGERGENFAALLKGIASDERLRSAYVSWLKQLTPSEVDDVTILQGALGESLFAVKERGVIYPAPILSDGTLRFAAIVAAFFQPDMPDLITIEEIENGIHPSRLRLLVELLKSQAAQNRQVMATTHSPMVLAWLQESDYATTFFCKRDEQTGASTIVPLTQVPRFLEIVKKQSIVDLFAEGWLEEAL